MLTVAIIEVRWFIERFFPSAGFPHPVSFPVAGAPFVPKRARAGLFPFARTFAP
jgi:hypothetical protein